MKNIKIISFLAVVLLIAAGCSRNNAGKSGDGGDRKKLRFPVEVMNVATEQVTYTIAAVGSVDPFEVVQVTARVAGAVDRVLFVEGKSVKSGANLVQIDAERYELSVASAKAALERAQASKADAEKGLARREAVIARTPGLIPGEELETWRTKVQVAISDVATAEAALRQTEVNNRDAHVRAPISGVIQSRTVQTGQYVQVGSVLATLVRRDPLLLRFKVPENEAARMNLNGEARFKVRDMDNEFHAVITFIGSAADPATRMVDVVANVKDPQAGMLRPGSFAEVRIPVEAARNAPVIPQTSVRTSEKGFLAYVIENDIAKERVLTLGMRTLDGRVEVLQGLKPGEVLVIRGAEALRDGAQVRMVPADSASRIPAADAGSVNR
jgi:multidrug efflux system membrane fusion protein